MQTTAGRTFAAAQDRPAGHLKTITRPPCIRLRIAPLSGPSFSCPDSGLNKLPDRD